MKRTTLATWCCLLALTSACKVYPSWDGEFSAGPADPFNYPPAYLGTGGDRARPAVGTFNEIAGYIAGERRGYYSFPFSTAALATSKPTPDPLALRIGDGNNSAVPTPKAYVFDGVNGLPFGGRPKCVAPADYTYDPFRDAMPRDRQDNLFSALPTAAYSFTRAATWSYAPVVTEVALQSLDYDCQGWKSEETLVKTFKSLEPSGRFLLWPIIDTGAAVYRLGQSSSNSNGYGPQHYGWFNHYIVAYLDGGYIPTVTDNLEDGTEVLRMRTQRIFFPRSQVITTVRGEPVTGNGALGAGYDVLEKVRGDNGFSPVCQVFTYDAGPATPVADLPRDADTIIANFESTLRPGNPAYFFCLQLPEVTQ